MTGLLLRGGSDAAPDVNDYLAAVRRSQTSRVAIVAAPDLGGHLTADADRKAVVTALLDTAASGLTGSCLDVLLT